MPKTQFSSIASTTAFIVDFSRSSVVRFSAASRNSIDEVLKSLIASIVPPAQGDSSLDTPISAHSPKISLKWIGRAPVSFFAAAATTEVITASSHSHSIGRSSPSSGMNSSTGRKKVSRM